MPVFPPLHDLPLPDFARIDLAVQKTMALPSVLTGLESLRVIPGDAFCIPLAIEFNLITDANPGNRIVVMVLRDADNVALARVVSSLQAVASGTTTYAFIATAASAWSTSVNAVTPIAPAIAFPGYKIGIRVDGAFGGDILSNPRLTCIDIPTGPELPATLVPQPLALT